MTTDEMMIRQESLGLRLPKAVAVVGCGGVGSWTALALAMAGVPELWLFDHDTISIHNLNRIPLPASTVGDFKTTAMREMILQLRPNCRVLAMDAFNVETANSFALYEQIDWIVATTDTLPSRQMTRQWAAEWGINYIEAGAEGEYGSATGEPATFGNEAASLPGYEVTPSWIGPCVFSSAFAVAHVVHNAPMGDRTLRVGFKDGRLQVSDLGGR